MSVTAEAVRQLRERTGAGMMECKKALVETGGNLDAAAEYMRKQGLAKADKKAARIAAEGVIVIERSADGRAAAMAEINCETDFVAREHDFRNFAADVVRLTLAGRPVDLNALLNAELAAGESVDARRRALVAKIGENISVRRCVVLESDRATRRLRPRHAHRRAGGAGGRERADWRTSSRCTWRRATRATSAPPTCPPRSRQGARDPGRAGPWRRQAAGDRRQDDRRPAAQVAERDRAARPALHPGPRPERREAAEGRRCPRDRASSASRSGPGSRRNRKISSPKSWPRSKPRGRTSL